MRIIKLSVLSFFLVCSAFLINRQLASPVSGKTGATALSAPTGVNASDGDYANKVGINWDTVRGATNYRIFRNTTNDPLSAVDAGTSAGNFFFDSSAAAGQQYYYWVRAENSGTQSGLGTSDSGIRAVAGTPHIFYNPLEPPPYPAGNPVTATKASLGKALFWDEQLSSTKTVACGTCHRPAAGGADPRSQYGSDLARNPGPNGVANPEGPSEDPRNSSLDDIFGSPGVPKNNSDGTYSEAPFYAFGMQVTGRHTPSYLNAGYSTSGLFWDGRALDVFRDPITDAIIMSQGGAIESQILGPPVSDVEMAHGGRDWTQVAQRIAASKPLALAHNIPASLRNWIGGRTYPELFEEAFGTPEVTPVRIAMAIATHERQLFSDRTPFDRFATGTETLTEIETTGATLFFGLNCTQCHDGPLFSDHLFHNIGIRPPGEDRGRGLVTNNPDNDGQFKTPPLRNIELQAPYMHNGRTKTLEHVIDLYNRGGNFNAPNIDRGIIRPMGLTTAEKQALVAFLKRPLTDPRVRDELPPFDRPKLFTESQYVPVISGSGRAGTGSVVPRAIAIEPPLVGNDSFTVAVEGGLANSDAVVVINATDPGVGTSIPAGGSFTRMMVTLNAQGRGSIRLAIPNDASLIGQTFHGRWYVPDAGAASGFSVSRLFSFTVFGETVATVNAAPFDLDGDGKTDVGVYRPNGSFGGEWWYLRSSDGGGRAFGFGASTDSISPADFTGDGKTDIAVFRPSTGFWYVMRSEDNTFYGFPFGAAGDVPVPADFDADGKADAAVFRAGTWFISLSSGGSRIESFGAASDLPVAADYDGDGKADLAVFRPSGASGAGEWWLNMSTQGVRAVSFGAAGDKAVPADYTGDGKTDVAVFRPSTGFWYILRSEDLSFYGFPFGVAGDVPSTGDYDGDGKADPAVFRAGTWYINRSAAGQTVIGFGTAGDVPVPSAFVR